MGIRVLAVMASVLIAFTVVACSEDADAPVVTPTVSAVASTPTTSPPTPEPTPTPLATPIAEAATLDGCPVDDAKLCQFALDAQDALNAEVMEFFVSRLAARERPCRDTIHSGEDDVGCPSSDEGTSVPLVGVLFYQSDCCLVLPERFEERFGRWLVFESQEGEWRVYAIERGGSTWDGAATVVLVRGTAPTAPLVTVGTTPDGELRVPGVIVGSLANIFLFPDREFLLWQ